MDLQGLNNKIGTLLSSYTQAVNKQNGWTGSLFQASTKAKKLSAKTRLYSLTCFHYIHQNPLKAGLVKQLGEWEFSSYQDYAGIRNGSLPDKAFTYGWLDVENKHEFVKQSLQSIDEQLIKKIY